MKIKHITSAKILYASLLLGNKRLICDIRLIEHFSNTMQRLIYSGVALTAGIRGASRVEYNIIRTISSFRLGFFCLFCSYRSFVSTAVTADAGVFSKFLAATKLATICGICLPRARTQLAATNKRANSDSGFTS